MKNIVGQQLDILLKSKNISQERFAELVGVGSSKGKTVNNWIKGRSGIPLDRFYQILEIFPELNLNWLFAGRGEMFGGDDDLGGMVVYGGDGPHNNICMNCCRLEGRLQQLESDVFRKDARIEVLAVEINKLKSSNTLQGKSPENSDKRKSYKKKQKKAAQNIQTERTEKGEFIYW